MNAFVPPSDCPSNNGSSSDALTRPSMQTCSRRSALFPPASTSQTGISVSGSQREEKKKTLLFRIVSDSKLRRTGNGATVFNQSSTHWDVSNAACQMMNVFAAASSVAGFMRTWMHEPIPQLSVQQDPLIFLSKTIKIKSGTFANLSDNHRKRWSNDRSGQISELREGREGLFCWTRVMLRRDRPDRNVWMNEVQSKQNTSAVTSLVFINLRSLELRGRIFGSCDHRWWTLSLAAAGYQTFLLLGRLT